MDIYIWRVGQRSYDFSTWLQPLRGEAASSRRRGDLPKQDLALLLDTQGDFPRVQEFLSQIYRGARNPNE